MTSALAGRWALVLVGAALLGTGAAASPTPSAARPAAEARVPLLVDQRAIDLNKATSARLAAAQSMGFTAIVDIEYPSKLGPPLAYPERYDVVLQRPDPLKLRYDMQLSNWQLEVRHAPATLASQKARAALRVAFAKPAAVALPPGSKAASQAAKPAASAPKTKTP